MWTWIFNDGFTDNFPDSVPVKEFLKCSILIHLYIFWYFSGGLLFGPLWLRHNVRRSVQSRTSSFLEIWSRRKLLLMNLALLFLTTNKELNGILSGWHTCAVKLLTADYLWHALEVVLWQTNVFVQLHRLSVSSPVKYQVFSRIRVCNATYY